MFTSTNNFIFQLRGLKLHIFIIGYIVVCYIRLMACPNSMAIKTLSYENSKRNTNYAILISCFKVTKLGNQICRLCKYYLHYQKTRPIKVFKHTNPQFALYNALDNVLWVYSLEKVRSFIFDRIQSYSMIAFVLLIKIFFVIRNYCANLG